MAVLVTNAPSPLNWTLRTPSGSISEWSVSLDLANGQGYPVSGATTWEYVVAVSSSSTRPLFTVGTTASDSGLITVTPGGDTATVVQLALYPAATVKLSGTYRHTLWMDQGTPGAFAWITGNLVAGPTPQPQ